MFALSYRDPASTFPVAAEGSSFFSPDMCPCTLRRGRSVQWTDSRCLPRVKDVAASCLALLKRSRRPSPTCRDEDRRHFLGLLLWRRARAGPSTLGGHTLPRASTPHDQQFSVLVVPVVCWREHGSWAVFLKLDGAYPLRKHIPFFLLSIQPL